MKDWGAWHAAVHGVQRVGCNLATAQQQILVIFREDIYKKKTKLRTAECQSMPIMLETHTAITIAHSQ